MSDNLSNVFKKFYGERTKSLFERFNGVFRARVEETNDPLIKGRVRVRIPELHNADVPVEDLPWATSAFKFGGKGCGEWDSLVKGDIVYVMFEKNHPYSPVWLAAADPTRRKFYPHQSIHGKTPLSVNSKGEPADSPSDYQEEYLPKDSRPMGMGWRNRYGTFLLSSSVGFFPKEHVEKPAAVGTDAIAKSEFQSSIQAPKADDPDVKYTVLESKYGHMMMLSDVGYDWQKEFKGDFDEDESYEIKRHKYLQKFFNENKPSGRDQRRIEYRSRYGHKLELRDVGWTKSRPGEFDNQNTISKESSRDERWVKLRSKGGMLIQSWDKGNDPVQDKEVKKLLLEDIGASDNEESFGDDGRQIRLVTRHGNKLVLDDRGSDKVDAEGKEEPRGNGFLLRTRRGFGLDFNDKDPMRRAQMYSPKSKVLELNDRFDYIMLCDDTKGKIPEKWEGKKGNEFATTVAMTHDPERDTNHLKLDKENHYVSLKTPEGQGLEMRDEKAPCASFTEMTGPEDRGIWLSRDHDRAVWRSKDGQMFIALDDGQKAIIIRNDNEKIQIIAQTDVEVIANQNINMKANKISMMADTEICMEAAGTHWVVRGGEVGTNSEIKCRRLNAVTMYGTHEVIQIPCDPCGPAPAGDATDCSADEPEAMDVQPRKPKPFDEERNCAPNKKQAKPVPGGGGGGAAGGGSGGFNIDKDGTVTVLPEQQPVDPLGESGGVLWYGTTDKFLDSVATAGIPVRSIINNNNTPLDLSAEFITLAMTLDKAQEFAKVAQKRYGGKTLIYRLTELPETGRLDYFPKKLIANFYRDIPAKFPQVYEIGQKSLTGQPQFQT